MVHIVYKCDTRMAELVFVFPFILKEQSVEGLEESQVSFSCMPNNAEIRQKTSIVLKKIKPR